MLKKQGLSVSYRCLLIFIINKAKTVIILLILNINVSEHICYLLVKKIAFSFNQRIKISRAG